MTTTTKNAPAADRGVQAIDWPPTPDDGTNGRPVWRGPGTVGRSRAFDREARRYWRGCQ